MKSTAAFYSKTAHSGGVIIIGAKNIQPFSTDLVLTRNAVGDYSLNRTAGGAETYTPLVMLPALKRLVETADSTLKGVKITDVFAVYGVGVANLTAASLALKRTAYANNVALAITDMPVAATALPLTFAGDATGPYVVKRAVTTPAFETTDLSDVALELSVTLANTGTVKIYALGFHVDFNYD